VTRNLEEALCSACHRWGATRLLAVGGRAARLLAACGTPATVARADPARAAALEAEAPYDLALVAGVLEGLGPARGGALLARLRDLLARRLLVVVPAGHPVWGRTRLLGLGLEHAGRHRLGDEVFDLYRFDIEHYKTTPDWLNADHWAHPELFGKFWW